VNPIVRPRYGRKPHPLGIELEVEAPDWPRLVDAATLATSDAVRPLGRFPTWTARRIAAKGAPGRAVLAAWLEELAALWRDGGFLPAFLEDLKTSEASAAAILRGGFVDAGETPPEFPLARVPREHVQVSAGGDAAPWKARFVLAR
jgi:hypothetical protein